MYIALMCVNLFLMLAGSLSLSILGGGVYDSLLDHSSRLLLDPRWPACCISNEGVTLCIKSICELIYTADMYSVVHPLS